MMGESHAKALSWAAAASLLVCVFLGWLGQGPAASGLVLERYAQEAGDAEEAATHATQRLRQTPDYYVSDYGFQNFNGDRLSVEYQVKRWAVAPYEAAFGYRKEDAA